MASVQESTEKMKGGNWRPWIPSIKDYRITNTSMEDN